MCNRFGTKMEFDHRPLIFLDCQTTGMRPPTGQILEIAWQRDSQLQSFINKLPQDQTIPPRVQEITGLTNQDTVNGSTLEEIFTSLTLALPPAAILVIHYAQFERPFLLDLFERFGDTRELPVDVICTHQLTKLLFPSLPSRNLRATAGFFGPAVLGPNRAETFVKATVQIWEGLKTNLEGQGIRDFETLKSFLSTKPNKKTASRYEYRLDRLKRLELPDEPGVYRMLAKNGEILYVGKATSLKSRVNSYFRGKKNRDHKKLEMLAQVWDLRVTVTRSPLEAALLESDEIKRHDPPYNIVMKRGKRHLVFYSRDFKSSALRSDEQHLIGPFRNQNWMEHLRLLESSLKNEQFEQIFFDPIEPELLSQGFDLFLALHNLQGNQINTVRSMLAYGLWLHKNYVEPEEDEVELNEPDDDEQTETEPELTPEDLAGKFERLLRRAGAEYWKTRRINRLLNSKVNYTYQDQTLELCFVLGSLCDNGAVINDSTPPTPLWEQLDLITFDRMSVLLSELNKYSHRIDSY